MSVRTHVQVLDCEMKKKEREALLEDLLQQQQELSAIDDERVAALAPLKERSQKAKERIVDIVDSLTRGTTKHSVTCDMWPDWQAGVMRTVRLDTGAALEERPLTFDERKGRLFELQGDDQGNTGLRVVQ